jgi:ankyrin repeat protein
MGTDPLAQEENGSTPLHIAACHGHLGTIRVVMDESEGDLCARDAKGYTPLHRAAVDGQAEMVKMLVDMVVRLWASVG